MDFLNKSKGLPTTFGQRNQGLALAPVTLPKRPGFVQTLLASREEREVLARQEEAGRAVEVAKIEAAAEVALDDIHHIKAIRLRSRHLETKRMQDEQKQMMTEQEVDANAALNRIAFQGALAAVTEQKRYLAEIGDQAAKFGFAPDEVQMLTGLIKHGTERLVNTLVETTEMMREDSDAQRRRALSRDRE
jgi:hypothetical protein